MSQGKGIVALLLGLCTVIATAKDLRVPADYPTIQAAVNAAGTNDTIHIAAGVYTEQVTVVSNKLTIIGEPGTILRATERMSPFSGTDGVPILAARLADLTLRGLTFDGASLGNRYTNPRLLAGLYFLRSSVDVENCTFQDFRESGRSTVDKADAIIGFTFEKDNVNVRVVGCEFSNNYSSIFLSGARSRKSMNMTIETNTIVGPGPLNTLFHQQGIFIGQGVAGRIAGNTISGFSYIGRTSSPAISFGIVAANEANLPVYGILEPLEIEGNTLRDCQIHVALVKANRAVVRNNLFQGTAPGIIPAGLVISGTGLTIANNQFEEMPEGIRLLGRDPIFGTALGTAVNAQVTSNRFCNVTTNINVQPLASATQEGTLECPFPFELTSFAEITNGVRLTWSDSGPGQAYTVQVRESLTSGRWRNAPTRYRWPWPFTHWADGPNLPRGRYYRVLSEAPPAAKRGKLLTSSLRGRNTTNQLKNTFANFGVTNFAPPKFGTADWVITYETIDPYGLPITNSALVIVPTATNGPLPFLSVQHGTLMLTNQAPTRPGSGDVWAAVLASYGYAVVVPDYLGLGSSPGSQAYVHAKSEATCVVDALRAGRSFCASNKVTLNGQLFLTGYSQGGHVTMAAHRELEAFHTNEFQVTASAPSAGPYDLGGVTIEGIIANPGFLGKAFFALMLASYLPIYQLGDFIEDLLAEPYRQTLPPRLDGNYGSLRIDMVMPADAVAILRPDFQADFRTNVNNPLRQALIENNVHDWTPKAPVKMVHCREDEIVIFANAEVAYQSFTNRGACCVSIVDPGVPVTPDDDLWNHEDCYIPSLREVVAWFETFRP